MCARYSAAGCRVAGAGESIGCGKAEATPLSLPPSPQQAACRPRVPRSPELRQQLRARISQQEAAVQAQVGEAAPQRQQRREAFLRLQVGHGRRQAQLLQAAQA